MTIRDNLNNILQSITDVAQETGRDSNAIELLAVSKTKPIESLIEAYNAGQRLFGENRVGEAETKVSRLPKDAIFHMIGHLQSNKVRKACRYFSCIQSVDSLKIARKIDNACRDIDKIMDIYLDINIVNDNNKSGFIVDENFYSAFEEILTMNSLNIVGLMCIGAHVEDKIIISNSFRDLKDLSCFLLDKYPTFHGDKLSMGMSHDFKEAIIEGATMVRVGSSIFGKRG